jgi:NADPH2:quinone reductase
MKEITFQGAGDTDVMRFVDEPMPEIKPNDLLVHVRAGINRGDILQRQGFMVLVLISEIRLSPGWR